MIIKQHLKSFFRVDSEVKAAFGTNLRVCIQVFFPNKGATIVALREKTLRLYGLILFFGICDRTLLFFKPIHSFHHNPVLEKSVSQEMWAIGRLSAAAQNGFDFAYKCLQYMDSLGIR